MIRRLVTFPVCLLLASAVVGCSSSPKPEAPVGSQPATASATGSSPAEGSSHPAEKKPEAAVTTAHTCALKNGAMGDASRRFTVRLEAPSKYVPQGDDDNSCIIGFGPSVDDGTEGVRVTVFVIHPKDGGPEKLLNVEPDGARQWAQKKSRGEATNAGEGRFEILGSTVPYYQLAQFRFAPKHETLIARVRAHDQNVVFIASYPPGSRDAIVPDVLDIAKHLAVTPADAP